MTVEIEVTGGDPGKNADGVADEARKVAEAAALVAQTAAMQSDPETGEVLSMVRALLDRVGYLEARLDTTLAACETLLTMVGGVSESISLLAQAEALGIEAEGEPKAEAEETLEDAADAAESAAIVAEAAPVIAEAEAPTMRPKSGRRFIM